MKVPIGWTNDRRYVWQAVLVAALALAIAIPALSLADGIGRAVHAGAPLEAATRSWGVDWTPRAAGVAATQGRALLTLARLVGAAGIAALAVGVLTLWAIYAIRGDAMRGEWTIHRAVGASRRMLVRAGVQDGAAVAGAALLFGAALGALGTLAIQLSWPGTPSWPGGVPDGTVLAALALIPFWIMLLAVAPFFALRRNAALGGLPVARRGLVVPGLQLGVTLAVLLAAARLVTPPRLAPERGENPTELVYRITVPEGRTSEERARLYGSLLDTLADAPSVGPVAVASPGMLLGLGPTDLAITDCGECWQGGLPAPFHPVAARYHLVSPDTFEAVGIPIVTGRAIRRDEHGTEPVAIVSRSLALRHFDRHGAVGRRIRVGKSPGTWHLVVGVADDRAPDGLASSQDAYAVYLSALQHPATELDLVVSAQSDGSAVGRAITEVLGPTAAPEEPTALRSLRQAVLRPVRWLVVVLGVAGGLALLLASYGVATVAALIAGRRRTEYALRRAVGARAQDIRRLAYGEAGRFVLLGLAIGWWLDLLSSGFVAAAIGPGSALPASVATGLMTLLAASAFVGVSGAARRAATPLRCAGLASNLS